MFGVIKRNPSLPLADIPAAFARHSTAWQANAGTSSYTGYSRFALLNIFKLLALPRGSTVLLPAYICDVILLPLTELGLEPVYYGITDRFQIDFDTIKLHSNTKAIITVNYFGLSQEFDAIESFVKDNRLIWINDNSHGFASRHGDKKLESFGDFSVTSFRKVLPTINGARVCINNDEYAPMQTALSTLNAAEDMENRVPRFLAATLLSHLRYRPVKFPDYSEITAFSQSDLMAYGLDPLSSNILGMTVEEHVQERRHRMYREIDAFLLGKNYSFLETIPKVLYLGNSPMVYPVVVRDRKHWAAVLQASRKQGVDIHTWPSMPQDVIAGDIFGSVTRWQQLLFLPVRQDIDVAAYCSRLAQVFDMVS